jgi:hypothetical protein
VKTLTTAIVMTLLLALPAQAEVYDPFITQLRDQGYTEITVGRTWLGRIVINAQRDDVAREIVLNARTGEILGDQASLIGAVIAPRYSDIDSDDDDNDRPIATVVTPPDDTATAVVTSVGDEPLMLDTGVRTVNGD